MPYKVTFTDPAKTAAEASSSVAAVEDIARQELADWGIDDLRKLGFHCIDAGGQRYMCSPRDAETLAIESLGRIEDEAG